MENSSSFYWYIRRPLYQMIWLIDWLISGRRGWCRTSQSSDLRQSWRSCTSQVSFMYSSLLYSSLLYIIWFTWVWKYFFIWAFFPFHNTLLVHFKLSRFLRFFLCKWKILEQSLVLQTKIEMFYLLFWNNFSFLRFLNESSVLHTLRQR